MATPNKKTRLPIADPAELANQRILAAREGRLIQKEKEESIDLGLNLKEPETAAPQNVAELIRDEFDKKSFGDAPKTTTRIVYGPDPIVDKCPEFHERLERFGLHGVAEAFETLVLKKGELAATDPLMRKALRNSINRFGREATARAFRDRILSIPSREVEIELDGALDPLIVNPMREAVARYGRPGMAVKFLSDRCMDVLGKRGYEIVKGANGDPVRIGTLNMGLIPQDWAERRRRHFAEESQSAVKEQEEAYYETVAREVRDAGGKGVGIAPLEPGDMVHLDPALNDVYTGAGRKVGISYE